MSTKESSNSTAIEVNISEVSKSLVNPALSIASLGKASA